MSEVRKEELLLIRYKTRGEIAEDDEGRVIGRNHILSGYLVMSQAEYDDRCEGNYEEYRDFAIVGIVPKPYSVAPNTLKVLERTVSELIWIELNIAKSKYRSELIEDGQAAIAKAKGQA